MWVEVVGEVGRGVGEGMEGGEEWRVVVEGVRGIRYKDGRDREGMVDDKERGCRMGWRIGRRVEGVGDRGVRE